MLKELLFCPANVESIFHQNIIVIQLTLSNAFLKILINKKECTNLKIKGNNESVINQTESKKKNQKKSTKREFEPHDKKITGRTT